jgi:hypothetical protein
MLHHVLSSGLFYNAVIISDYRLLMVGLVNWEGSGSTCGLMVALLWYLPGSLRKHTKNLIQNSQRPAKTQRRHIPNESLKGQM